MGQLDCHGSEVKGTKDVEDFLCGFFDFAGQQLLPSCYCRWPHEFCSISKAVSDMAEGASLTYGKAVEFCATQPGTEEISKSFATYLRNFEAGTRAGFIAVDAPDPGESVLTSEGRTVAARTGDDIRKVVQSAPSTACARLLAELNSGTEARFEEKIVEGMREYKQKRHAFCAKVPRPTNCQPNE